MTYEAKGKSHHLPSREQTPKTLTVQTPEPKKNIHPLSY